ncbi:MAG: SAM-dependent methyltransferase [Deltaproteobacteria bacterium]|nr:MAG: SAM-dependent methyltransferase [Deltaproteobacteria bacterium]
MNPTNELSGHEAPPKHLPYFDALIDRLEKNDEEIAKAFGHHMHWGCWTDPSQAKGTVADFFEAAENLSRRLYEAAGVQDGMRLLDVGCGFGGTIAALNERFSGMKLVGLNIDERQLAYARRKVHPKNGNEIEFIEGDACRLPFGEDAFDVVLAVECIFHFPSRRRFLDEARRVLRPSGRLALSDFIPHPWIARVAGREGGWIQRIIARQYGTIHPAPPLPETRRLFESAGFVCEMEADITPNTLPTYRMLRKLAKEPKMAVASRALEWISRRGLVRYVLFACSPTPESQPSGL